MLKHTLVHNFTKKIKNLKKSYIKIKLYIVTVIHTTNYKNLDFIALIFVFLVKSKVRNYREFALNEYVDLQELTILNFFIAKYF